jgi:hypothetical protein
MMSISEMPRGQCAVQALHAVQNQKALLASTSPFSPSRISRDSLRGLSAIRSAVGQEAVQLPHWMHERSASTSVATAAAKVPSGCSLEHERASVMAVLPAGGFSRRGDWLVKRGNHARIRAYAMQRRAIDNPRIRSDNESPAVVV